MHRPHVSVRWLLFCAVALIATAGLIVWWGPWRGAADSFPLTPIADSPYLNTRADATYVGSEACYKCHEDRRDSFRTTGMGRSMAAVVTDQEPPDATFEHAPSQRRYQIFRKDGALWHRESLLQTDVVLSEYPLKYVVGSGRHSRTYLVEAEGFLVESPVTWYASRKAWGMSPGYDRPEHVGFQRATGEGCLHCHAGRAEAVGGSLHRMHVHESALGCERCHGPGSLHVERRSAGGGGEPDLTIVNPSKLSRELAEAVCQQCHLRATAMVPARGRKIGDFRPGLPLEDFVHAYMLDATDRQMTVVGHVEQLHLSRCYQASDKLTCLTCHSPHAEPSAQQRVPHYKAACQTCHQPASCKVDAMRRERESPGNDCVHCHMPQSATEIPHLAFTHHRIGIHKAEEPTKDRGQRGELKPFLNLARFGAIDRKRSLGLAYAEAANREKTPAGVNAFRTEAVAMLSETREAGLRDASVEAGLARVIFDLGHGDAVYHVKEALKYAELTGQDRCNVLFIQADYQSEHGLHAEALPALEELTQLRRHPSDWLLLADTRRALGKSAEADKALATAVVIDPRLTKVHRHLADQYVRQGDPAKAAWHAQRTVP